MKKLIIWKCAGEGCCNGGLPLLWHAGTVKHKPFFSTYNHQRALDFFRTEWSA